MGTLGGFPNPPALWLRRAKPAFAYAIMGTLKGSPNPRWYAASDEGARSAGRAGWAVRPEAPVGGSRRLPTRTDGNPQRVPNPSRDGPRRAKLAGLPTRHVMGTLKGFPCPPAMVRGEQSSPAPHAIDFVSPVARFLVDLAEPNALRPRFFRLHHVLRRPYVQLDCTIGWYPS